MKFTFWVGILALSLAACNNRQPLLSIELESLNGNTLKLQEIKNHQATVICFLSPECPLCQNYSLNLKELEEAYIEQDILFLGVFPGEWYSKEEISTYTRKYDLQFTMLLDKSNTLVNSLEATVTPEAFLIDNTGKILYQGRIDDWVGTLGTKKEKANVEFLKNAIIAHLSNQTINPDQTEPVGCLIE